MVFLRLLTITQHACVFVLSFLLPGMMCSTFGQEAMPMDHEHHMHMDGRQPAAPGSRHGSNTTTPKKADRGEFAALWGLAGLHNGTPAYQQFNTSKGDQPIPGWIRATQRPPELTVIPPCGRGDTIM
jgi:hypothetical protein